MILVLTSCTSKGAVNEVNYRTGTEGVEISFHPSMPTKVYEGNSLSIMVEVENKGAFPHSDTFEGYLVLSGPTPAAMYFGDPRKIIPVDLQGRSYDYPDGTTEIVSYDTSRVEVPGDAESFTAPVLITSCYRYETLATPTICIDPDPYNTVQTIKACHVQDNVPISSGQGGPVVVSSLEQTVSPSVMTIRMKIRNANNGIVLDYNAMNSCIDQDLEYLDVDRVSVSVSSPSLGRPQSCSPEGTALDPVILYNGQGYMTCRFDIAGVGSAAYSEQLEILLNYGYSESIKKNIKIINLD